MRIVKDGGGAAEMQREERDLLDVLKDELKFMESGGYAHSPGASWRPVFIF